MDSREKNSKIILIALAALLVLSLIGNIYFFQNNHKLNTEKNTAVLYADSVLSSKLQVNKQLDQAIMALDHCTGKSIELDSLIKALNQAIKTKKNNLIKPTHSAGTIKQQLKISQKLNKEYVELKYLCNAMVWPA